MIKYYVRTTGERILDKSYGQIKYELLIDTEHNARKSFVEQLERLAELNQDVVILEDDLELCKDFKNKIESVIEEYKDNIVNFFYKPRDYFKTKLQKHFCWNQCVYYPKELLKLLAKEMRVQYESKPLMPHDEVENIALNKLGIKNVVYRPCLVQHLDFKSLVGNTSKYRITPYYIDYLEELNIPYEKACFFVNLSKLYKLLEEHIKIKRIEIFEPQNENEGVEKK